MCDSKEADRVASGSAGAPEIEDEIEITPEMIEAGTAVLFSFETLTASEEYWAKRVYRAMETVRRLGVQSSMGCLNLDSGI